MYQSLLSQIITHMRSKSIKRADALLSTSSESRKRERENLCMIYCFEEIFHQLLFGIFVATVNNSSGYINNGPTFPIIIPAYLSCGIKGENWNEKNTDNTVYSLIYLPSSAYQTGDAFISTYTHTQTHICFGKRTELLCRL